MDAAILTTSIKNCGSYVIALHTRSHGWYMMQSPSSQHDKHVSIVTIFLERIMLYDSDWSGVCKAHLGKQGYS